MTQHYLTTVQIWDGRDLFDPTTHHITECPATWLAKMRKGVREKKGDTADVAMIMAVPISAEGWQALEDEMLANMERTE